MCSLHLHIVADSTGIEYSKTYVAMYQHMFHLILAETLKLFSNNSFEQPSLCLMDLSGQFSHKRAPKIFNC